MTDGIVPAFQDEMQFIRYGDGSRTGPIVTFRLPDRSYLERFIGKEGRRFASVLVEIGDDETPVQPEPEVATEPAKGGPLAKWAALRCQDARFWAWLRVADELTARGEILAKCGIRSRAELDSNPDAAGLFARHFRMPWADHCKRMGWVD